MSCNITTIANFDRQAKKLAKHYPSFRKDFEAFLCELSDNPFLGTDLGNGIRKVRMTITSKGKGKSGGARIITYNINIITQKEDREVILLSIYDKSQQSNISDNDIIKLKHIADNQ